MKRMALLVLLAAPASALPPLPPLIPWSGKSRELVVAVSDPWITPSETSALRLTPNYEETVTYLRKLDAAAPDMQMVSIGRSGEGRDIWMVIASRDRAFTPEALRRSGKPIVLAQGGIHSGEIDGKDAGLMLLRDMTVRGTRRQLLDRANFLFVPIFNVDGHERASRYGRINQRGPEVMGWRTNAQNLNLNRDYTKLDTPEVRAIVGAINRWSPDLYLDLHVTDGADYQYDITYGWNTSSGLSPAGSKWLDETLAPALARDLAAMGHIPGPLVFPINESDDPAAGLSAGNSGARLSNGYGDARHLPTVLLENHSLKPYDQRVLGTYIFLASALETAGRNGVSLRTAIASDQRRRVDPVTLDFEKAELSGPDGTIEFLGIESRTALSPVSGSVRRQWLGKPVTMRLKIYRETVPIATATRPRAYWIPAQWTDVIERVKMHGITMERADAPRELDVESYRIADPKLKAEAFEGHVQVDTMTMRTEKRRERFPTGSYRVPTDQPLGTLAMLMLEPASPESFLQWGFFHSILQRTEYSEAYVTEPLAEEMLAKDPKLAEEFKNKLTSDAAFRNSATARLAWFYSRTPYADDRWLLYPVAREIEK